MKTIEFEVSYELREYLRLTREHILPFINQDRVEKGKSAVTADDWILRVTHGAMMTPIYVYRVLRIGRCKFKIDADGIRRNSKDGSLFAAWNDVVDVRRFSGAYLIAKADGAMPLPYRCFTPQQRADFEAQLAALNKLS